MKKNLSFKGRLSSLRKDLHRHRVLVTTLVLLMFIAVSSRLVLRGDLLGGRATNDGSAVIANELNVRVCSSVGTVFEDIRGLPEVRQKFRDRVSEVVAEREKFLATPSEWQCISKKDGSTEPPMEKLKKLAEDMPGWHAQYRGNNGADANVVRTLRPVTFASFSSILGEFEREYECKLSELQNQSLNIVATNYDLSSDPQYCFTGQNRCSFVTDDTVCTGPETSAVDCGDPACIGTCLPEFNQSDITQRISSFHTQQGIERQRARTAIERTLLTLRSLEMHYAYARNLTCFQRASMDLKNEISLLADAVSCMPRIWDAVTSIHDRKP